MNLINKKNNLEFYLDNNFETKYLLPIHKYVEWKLNSDNWDDYNEFFHSSKYFEALKRNKNIKFDSHLLYKEQNLIGCVFIAYGKISTTEKKYEIENEESSLLLKYFHIVDKGNGHGSYWLNEIILPYYQNKGYLNIYINSSHPKSFDFYEKLGTKICSYEQTSDNDLFKRNGACFKLKINAYSD